jgi:hypothetical protein
MDKSKNIWLESEVAFTYALAQNSHQVVGQLGFFDKFKIKFDHTLGKVTLQMK